MGRILATSFPETRFLGVEAVTELVERIASAGVAGGTIYDALVAATAVEHDLPLVTRDRRALDTYRALGVRVVEVLE